MKKNLKGFTLVEVLIVIIIVGILIAALLPRLIGTQARARNTARAAHLNQIASAVALYAVDNPTAAATFSGCSDTALLNPYLATRPTDPSTLTVTNGGCGAGLYTIHRSSTDGSYWVCGMAENSNGDYTAFDVAFPATADLVPVPGGGNDMICNIVRG